MFETKWYKRTAISKKIFLKQLESQPFLISSYLPNRAIKLYWSNGKTDYASSSDYGDSRARFYSYLEFLFTAGYREIPAAEAVALLL